MANPPITINLDRMADAMLDTRTAHYWDPKRGKLIRGSSELDDEKGRRVLVDTIGNRKLKKLTDGFARLLDSKDAKLVQEAVKGSFDRFNKLLQKRADLKKEWVKYAGRELAEAAVDWLAMQGVEEFVATGDLARFAFESIAEEAAESDEDLDEEEEAEEEEDAAAEEEAAEGEEEEGEEEEEAAEGEEEEADEGDFDEDGEDEEE
ncbi:MAG: hypothetical protein IT463_00265 [Planctomycetes bacterium]|nr:hypothetical protein [Planctomycetota bacterium]